MLTVLFTFSASAQKFVEIDLMVNGIASGTPYSTVIKKIGKPKSETGLADEIDECTGGRGKVLSYDGFEINMMGDENGRKQTVLDMEITSPQWVTSTGIKIGATPQQVMAKYGKVRYEDDFEYKQGNVKVLTGEKTLVYEMKKNGPGGTTFYFKNDRLVRIELKATTY